ncbi:MAG: nitroreductase [Syntrophomonas sp.]
MNVHEALIKRYTCRAFKPDPVSPDTIKEVLELANRTPSWGNTQPWQMYVAGGAVLDELRRESLDRFSRGIAGETDLPIPQEWPEAMKKRYIAVGKERFALLAQELDKDSIVQSIMERNYAFFDAPVVIYLCMDRSLTPYSMYDLGALSQSIMLSAAERGLNTAPAIMLVQYPDIIRESLSIPENLAIVLGIALGYGDEGSIHNRFRTGRRPLAEVVSIKGC